MEELQDGWRDSLLRHPHTPPGETETASSRLISRHVMSLGVSFAARFAAASRAPPGSYVVFRGVGGVFLSLSSSLSLALAGRAFH